MSKEMNTVSDSASRVAAARYREKAVFHQTPDGIKLIERVSVAAGTKVLDLGCGTGALARALAERVGPDGKVVGVDPDSERIKVAIDNYVSPNLPQLEFYEKDGENFPEDQYDLVFSNVVLHWIKDKNQVFKRVRENLSPTGQFAFTVGENLPALQVEMTNLLGHDQAKKVLGKTHFIPLEQYEELASANGFKLAQKCVEERVYSFPDIGAALDGWFATQQGDFDISLIDQAALERFKVEHPERPINIVLPLHFFVFTL